MRKTRTIPVGTSAANVLRMTNQKRRTKARPLFLVAAGAAALTYIGCNEPQAIGNPKRPPDMGPDLSVPTEHDMAQPTDLRQSD